MRILSIDGGGIRGIIPGEVLVALEAKLQQLSKKPKMRIADAFDLVAGTSTGGILTCLYLCPDGDSGGPKFSAEQAVDLYLQNGDDIFDVSVWKKLESLGGLSDEKYSADTLERVLRQYLGDTLLSDVLKPCLVTSYDITRRQARFFNKADVKDESADAGRNFYLRDVARATSAAPTYFEPANIMALDRKVYTLVDGGVFANNPAMCACVEAFSLDPELTVENLMVLSLGTGEEDAPYHYSEAKNWGKIAWLKPIIDILMSGVAETVDYQLRMLFGAAKVQKQYLRIQADLADFKDVDGAMDHASEKNMMALEEAGQKVAAAHDKELTAFAKALLAADGS
jgi:patatin-like phospholipase/acyl hydrolase